MSDEDEKTIVPTSNDVLLGRGREISTWEGNKRYLVEIERNTERYRDASTRAERVQIILGIVEHVKTWGRFLDQSGSDGAWYPASITKIRKKVGQALRYQMEQAKYDPLRRQASSSRRLSSTAAASQISSSSATARTTRTTPATTSTASQGPGDHVAKGGNDSSSDEKEKRSTSSSESSFGIPLGAYGEETQSPLLSDVQILSSIGVASASSVRDEGGHPADEFSREDEADRKLPATQNRTAPLQQESLFQNPPHSEQKVETESRKRSPLMTDQDILVPLLAEESAVEDRTPPRDRKKKKTESPL